MAEFTEVMKQAARIPAEIAEKLDIVPIGREKKA